MILRILFLTCTLFASQAFGKMDLNKFSGNFEDMCFQNEPKDPFRVNGQETPLSNTLENFIALAEKFEAANPTFDLKDELTYFLSEYVFEDIKFVNGRVSQWIVELADFKIIDEMWDPDVNGYKPLYNDPYSDAEKCSLFYMISHSILMKDKDLLSARSYSPGNYSSRSAAHSEELNPDEYFPQEMGVVAIKGTDAAVSLSKVLKGLFVGLKPNRRTDINDYGVIDTLKIPADEIPHDKTVDALFAVTLADVIMRAKWTGSNRRGLAPNGKWVSIPIDAEKKIDGFCPMVYLHQTLQNGAPLPAYSYSSVRGAADGLILGLVANDVYTKKTRTKLSQLLRMYYSPDGITVDNLIEELNSKHVSFCERQNLMQYLEQRLSDQTKLYGFLIAIRDIREVNQTHPAANTMYRDDKNTIFAVQNTELREFCERSLDISKPEDLRRETNLDVIVVMDSSSSKNSFEEQQMITGYLAKYLDLRYTGSQMTILLDHKTNTPSGTSSKIELKPVVIDAYSSSCAACTVGQIGYEQSNVERADVIVAIDQFLQERKENETKLFGVNGKVVVYFNYDNNDNGRSNNKIQGSLEKALRELHLRHQDVIFYAVGLDPEMLKRYAKNDPSLVSLATDGPYDEVAKRIYEKISYAPALLQYSECEDEKAEKTISYESIVSPHIIQHYSMPAEYFYKSLKITFKFEAQNGNIRVCYNRATMKPEMEMRNCKNTTSKDGAEFKMSNPCKGFSKETCSPFYFSVMGMNGDEGEMRTDTRRRDYCNDLNEKWCATLDQVRFKVSHTGVRCSGCLGLGAPPTVVLFTLLLTYIMYKKF